MFKKFMLKLLIAVSLMLGVIQASAMANTELFHDDFSVINPDEMEWSDGEIIEDINGDKCLHIGVDSGWGISVIRPVSGASGLLKFKIVFSVADLQPTAAILLANSSGNQGAFFGYLERGWFGHRDINGINHAIAAFLIPTQKHELVVYLDTASHNLDVVFDGEMKISNGRFMYFLGSIGSICVQAYTGNSVNIYEAQCELIDQRMCVIDEYELLKDGEGCSSSLDSGEYTLRMKCTNDMSESVKNTMLMCLYNGDVLESIAIKNAEFLPGVSTECSVSLNVGDPSGKKLKAFCWDSITSPMLVGDKTFTLE